MCRRRFQVRGRRQPLTMPDANEVVSFSRSCAAWLASSAFFLASSRLTRLSEQGGEGMRGFSL